MRVRLSCLRYNIFLFIIIVRWCVFVSFLYAYNKFGANIYIYIYIVKMNSKSGIRIIIVNKKKCHWYYRSLSLKFNTCILCFNCEFADLWLSFLRFNTYFLIYYYRSLMCNCFIFMRVQTNFVPMYVLSFVDFLDCIIGRLSWNEFKIRGWPNLTT